MSWWHSWLFFYSFVRSFLIRGLSHFVPRWLSSLACHHTDVLAHELSVLSYKKNGPAFRHRRRCRHPNNNLTSTGCAVLAAQRREWTWDLCRCEFKKKKKGIQMPALCAVWHLWSCMACRFICTLWNFRKLYSAKAGKRIWKRDKLHTSSSLTHTFLFLFFLILSLTRLLMNRTKVEPFWLPNMPLHTSLLNVVLSDAHAAPTSQLADTTDRQRRMTEMCAK